MHEMYNSVKECALLFVYVLCQPMSPSSHPFARFFLVSALFKYLKYIIIYINSENIYTSVTCPRYYNRFITCIM